MTLPASQPAHADRPAAARAAAYARAMAAENGYGLYLGANVEGRFVHAPSEDMVLLLGPPRSGKTSSIVIPNVLSADGALVVASTKRDVLDATWHTRSLGGRCALFDPGGEVVPPPGVTPVGWSPLVRSRSWEGSVQVVQVMLGAARPAGRTITTPADSFWSDRAASLLAPVFHAGALDGLLMRDVVSWVNRRDMSEPLRILGKADATAAHDLLTGVSRTDQRELSGVWSTAATILGAYRSEAALRASELPWFDADSFVHPSQGAPTLYVSASGEHQRYAAPLVAGLVDDVRRAAYARQPKAPPVLAILDELANIAPLQDLPEIVSQGASQGLLLLACLQDLSQARARWPHAEGFHTLFGTRILLPGIGDMPTLEAVSALCGQREVPVRSTTRGSAVSRLFGRGPGSSTTLSTRKEPRLPVDGVARGRPGEALVLRRGQEPAYVRLTAAHLHPFWRVATGEGLARADPVAAVRQAPPGRTGLSR